MRRRRTAVTAALLLGLVAGVSGVAAVGGAGPAAAGSRHLPGTSCPVFPADSYWHADVSQLPVHPRSADWLAHMSPDLRIHPDFGSSHGGPAPYGIPVTVVGGGHRKVAVAFEYADESDQVRYPLGADTRIEGGRAAGGDRHAIVVDRSSCRLYETFATYRRTDGTWTAGAGSTWRLTSNRLRPDGLTSADAAGLPLLPGLLRWDEVRAGHVDHAVRFTTDVTDRSHVWPARHDAGSVRDPAYPPMGARFRLRASFPLAGYRADTRVVLRAMQRYGLVLADNGSPWFVQGTADNRWPDPMIEQLKTVPASAFEAVDTAPLQVRPGSARAAH